MALLTPSCRRWRGDFAMHTLCRDERKPLAAARAHARFRERDLWNIRSQLPDHCALRLANFTSAGVPFGASAACLGEYRSVVYSQTLLIMSRRPQPFGGNQN